MNSKIYVILTAACCCVAALCFGVTYFLYQSQQLKITQIEGENNNLNSQLTNTQKSLGDAKQLITNIQDVNIDLGTRLTAAQKQLDQMDQKTTDLQTKVDSLAQEIVHPPIIHTHPMIPWDSNHDPIPVYPSVPMLSSSHEQPVAYDRTGHTFKGTFMNGAHWAPGMEFKVLEFDGNGQYVSLGNILQDRYDNFSIACWVKHDSSSWQNIVERGVWDNPDGLGLMMDYFGHAVDFGHYDNFVRSKTDVQDNQWHFVVGTLAKGGDQYIYSIYVDGRLDNTAILTVGVTATSQAWAIGARYEGSWSYQGLIADVHLYDRTLSPDEIDQYFRQSIHQYSN